MMRVSLSPDRYADASLVDQAFRRIVEEVRAIPGVQNAGAGTRVPMWGASIDMGVRVDGRPELEKLGHVRLVTTGYLETLHMRITRGRGLTDADMAAGAKWVIVVNETFARNLFGNDDPLGQRISGWTREDNKPEWREIVGVVSDVRAFGRDNDIPAEIYAPLTQAPLNAWNAFQRQMTIIARSPSPAVASAMRRAVSTVDPLLPVYDLQTMDDVLTQSTSTRRFSTLLLTLLGITGLVLAAIGIYGVIAYFVSQRTHEIGVRVALGASTRSVVRMVVRQALALAIIGIVAGAVMSVWATRALAEMLYDTSARDPVAYGAAAAVLFVVALGASWIPARRAARVEPVRALGSS